MRSKFSFAFPVLLGASFALVSCTEQLAVEPTSLPTQPQTAGEAGPDPGNLILHQADIYDVSGNDLITVISPPFPDDAVVGAWIAVRLAEDLPIEYFQIVANEHFDQWNISVFSVDEDLEATGGSYWWMYSGSEFFDIVGSTTPEPNRENAFFPDREPRPVPRWGQ